MPWLAGATLARLLEGGRCFELPEALWLARQAAQGLAALHAAGWVHGDVKPSNVFVAADGHVTLIDLGFARRVGENDSDDPPCIAATLAYAAPECLRPDAVADPRSDLFSLGTILYELLTGSLPGRDVAPGRAVGMPTEVARLLGRMLAQQPLRRVQDARQLVARLAAVEIESFAWRGA
jgi:serine/threonine protein kinase